MTEEEKEKIVGIVILRLYGNQSVKLDIDEYQTIRKAVIATCEVLKKGEEL